MDSYVSIAEAGRLLGISRPRLSKLIKEFGLEKRKQGGAFLVRSDEVTQMVERLREEGRIRVRAGGRTFPEGAASDGEQDEPAAELEELRILVQCQAEKISELNQRLARLEAQPPPPAPVEDRPENPPAATGGLLRRMFAPWGS